MIYKFKLSLFDSLPTVIYSVGKMRIFEVSVVYHSRICVSHDVTQRSPCQSVSLQFLTASIRYVYQGWRISWHLPASQNIRPYTAGARNHAGSMRSIFDIHQKSISPFIVSTSPAGEVHFVCTRSISFISSICPTSHFSFSRILRPDLYEAELIGEVHTAFSFT